MKPTDIDPEWDMTFVIGHRPRPYTRTTRTQQWVDERWHRYIQSRDHIRADVREQMALHGWQQYLTREHLSIHITIVTGSPNYNNVDLDNEVKGIVDALQHVIFPNDAWIDELYAIRCLAPKGIAMAIVKIRQQKKHWFAIKALNLDVASIGEHGVMGAIRRLLGKGAYD